MFAYNDGDTSTLISEAVMSYTCENILCYVIHYVRIYLGNIRDFQGKDIFAQTTPITSMGLSIILLETDSQ